MTKNEGNNEHAWEDEAELHLVDVCPLFTAPESWYRDLVHYLQAGLFPKHWNSKQRRALHLKSASYQIVEEIIFRKNYDGVLLKCLEKEDVTKVMTYFHDSPVWGYFSGDTTAHKILRSSYYWPTLFKDAHTHVRKCDICQRCSGRQYKAHH